MSEISKLHPKLVWEIFDAITTVPRPSKKEEKIIKFVIDFAKKHNLEYKTDKAGNVVIRKPATAKMKGRPTVILQSHMDMVCEKNADVKFDFDNDPIQPYIDGEWVKARGTTLGADDGIGMACAMAVLIDNTIEHPAIEALFTVDEETGLTGAFNLAKNMITGKYLINLDSEDEGEICIGCAGGIDTVATFTYKQEEVPTDYVWMRADISGLKGGHSGDNIGDGLGNSNRLLTRLLLPATDKFGLRLNIFDGGNLRNAIPREAYAVFGVPKDKAEKFREFAENMAADIKEELKYTDEGFKMTIADAKKPKSVIDKRIQKRMLKAIQGCVNGVLEISRAMPGLVQTSTNLASVKFADGNKILVTLSQRSSIESEKFNAAATVRAIFELAGAKVRHGEGYPGWAPDPSSELLKVSERAYKRLFNKKPVVCAIHAGLECGLFLEKYPDLEMISVGPTLRGVHSPDERMEIKTVDMFWKLLVEILRTV